MTKIRVPSKVARELRAERRAREIAEAEPSGWDVQVGEKMERVSAEAFLFVLRRLKNNMAAIEMFRLDEPWLLNQCERDGLTEADVYRAAGIWSDIFAAILQGQRDDTSSAAEVVMGQCERMMDKGRRLDEWVKVAKRKVGEQA